MAANKFATMLHRNTHRMAVILVYTVLEWTLIALLLLNAVFSYLIAKFAAFFGLQPPCLFCSRVDHVFEPGRSYRDLLCDAHAAEVSRLGYCSRHRRLAEAGDMCEDCSSSRPSETTETIALLSWMKRSEAGEKDLRCSCCDVILESGFYSPYLVVKPSWDVFGITQNGNLVEEGLEEVSEGVKEVEALDQEGDKENGLVSFVRDDTDFEGEGLKDEEKLEGWITQNLNLVEDVSEDLKEWDAWEQHGEKEDQVVSFVGCDRGFIGEVMNDEDQVEGDDEMGALLSEQEQQGTAFGQCSDTCILVDDTSLEVLTMHTEKILDVDEGRLVPVELIDSTTLMDNSVSSWFDREDDADLENNILEKDFTEEMMALVSIMEIMDRGSPQILEMVDFVEEHPSAPPTKEATGVCSADHRCVVPEVIHAIPQDNVDIEVEVLAAAEDLGQVQGMASEDENKAMDAETNCEISIGSEICDQEQIDQSHLQEQHPMAAMVEVHCSEDHHETTNKDEVTETEPVEINVCGIDRLSICPELNEIEEERAPETPNSIEGIHTLHKRLFFDRRESGTESLDGSVVSEIEGSETLTMDRLKAALKSERKTLSALYSELEEERSASAIAANQTMAMITRLQEEKAAMQMEALQYQRMMDEQSEYDQEALQLMNELMMKREKEKQDLEKELEVYRKKIHLYEAKERRKMVRTKVNGRSGTSSASSSAEDSDDFSSDLHEGDEFFKSLNESNQNTPSYAVLSSGEQLETNKHLITLDESLDDFEEERFLILEQLKALEEKLFTMDDEERSNNLSVMEQISEGNGHVLNGNYKASGNRDENGFVNGFSDDLDANGKLHGEWRSIGCRGKRLLPLFDAISMENEGDLCPEQEESDASPKSVSKCAINQKQLAIAAEVDNVYERLHALEADREFLKHCISSLKKGEKGMDLLQEILQHLRDLRNVEFRVRNGGDMLASLSA